MLASSRCCRYCFGLSQITDMPSPHSAVELPPVNLSEHEGVRYLHLGTPWVQGAMRLQSPQHIELEYVQRMLACLLWLPRDILDSGSQSQAVQLGLGAATITRFTVNALGFRTRVVELNPQVVTACKLWFALPPAEKGLSVEIQDAGEWVQQPQWAQSTHILHVDLYDHDAAAPVLDDEVFYAHCRRMLVPGGVMAVNLFGRHASFERSVQRIASAFGASQVWRMQATREGNTVVIAGRDVVVPAREVLIERAAHIEQRFAANGLPAHKWLRMVRSALPGETQA